MCLLPAHNDIILLGNVYVIKMTPVRPNRSVCPSPRKGGGGVYVNSWIGRVTVK